MVLAEIIPAVLRKLRRSMASKYCSDRVEKSN
jgi:hypothetical protein